MTWEMPTLSQLRGDRLTPSVAQSKLGEHREACNGLDSKCRALKALLIVCSINCTYLPSFTTLSMYSKILLRAYILMIIIKDNQKLKHGGK